MTTAFEIRLVKRLLSDCFSHQNDNIDEHRFAREMATTPAWKKIAIRLGALRIRSLLRTARILKHSAELTWTYNHLADEESKRWLVALMAFRSLGGRRVKLDSNNKTRLKNIEYIETKLLKYRAVQILPDGQVFNDYDLQPLGVDATWRGTMGGILYPFILKQYALERGEYTFSALPGDTVIDCGGCYGDTTLYFANAVGSQGRVYCYEFDPENLKIYKYNMDINPTLSARTWLLENALWSISGQKMCVVGEGPDRRVVPLTSESADTDTTVTDTIDAAAERLNISDVNLIKMDIEGAELGALIGARRTILRDRPKLAICIYHRLDHFWKVPQFIDSLNCGYEFRIGHFTIHAEETVLFAEVPRYAKSLSESRQPIPT